MAALASALAAWRCRRRRQRRIEKLAQLASGVSVAGGG